MDDCQNDGARVERVEIPMPFPVFATPSLTTWCSMRHRDSMLELKGLLTERGIPHAVIGRGGQTFPDLARDILFTQFIDHFPKATDLFWIDDDVGFPAEKAIQFLIRPEPVIAGIYPKKQDETDFPVRLIGDKETGAIIENSGLVRVDRCGAGFLRVKRAVCDAMAERAVKYRDPNGGPDLYHVFSNGLAEDPDLGGYSYFGEDTIFISRAINLGFEVWADPDIEFSHAGRKTWKGNLLTELLKRGEKTPEGIRPNGVMVQDAAGVVRLPNPSGE